MSTQSLLGGKRSDGMSGRKGAGSPALVAEEGWTGTVPNAQRRFRDTLFTLLFLVGMGGFIALSSTAFSRGEPSLAVSGRARGLAADIAAAFHRHWKDLAAGAGIALGLSYAWLTILQVATKAIIYASLALAVISLSSLGLYLLTSVEGASAHWTGVAVLVVAAIVLAITLMARRKIALTATVMKHATSAVKSNPMLSVVGLVMVVFLVGWASWWLATLVYLLTIPRDDVDVSTLGADENIFQENIRYSIIFMVFMGYWVTAVLNGLFRTVTASVTAEHYFRPGGASAVAGSSSSGPVAQPGTTTTRALGRALGYSFGSIAFASLVVALLQLVQFLLQLAEEQERRARNLPMRFLLCCIRCLFACIEGMVRIVNRYAFVYMAMYGGGFCACARRVTDLFGRSGMSAVFTDILSGYVLALGALFCGALTTVIMAAMDGNHVSAVAVSGGVVAYLIFQLVALVVHGATDTVLVCFLEDLERNSASGAYRADPELLAQLSTAASARGVPEPRGVAVEKGSAPPAYSYT